MDGNSWVRHIYSGQFNDDDDDDVKEQKDDAIDYSGLTVAYLPSQISSNVSPINL